MKGRSLLPNALSPNPKPQPLNTQPLQPSITKPQTFHPKPSSRAYTGVQASKRVLPLVSEFKLEQVSECCNCNRQALEALSGWLSKIWSFWGTLNFRCRIIIRIQKGTLILTTTQVLTKPWVPSERPACWNCPPLTRLNSKTPQLRNPKPSIKPLNP